MRSWRADADAPPQACPQLEPSYFLHLFQLIVSRLLQAKMVSHIVRCILAVSALKNRRCSMQCKGRAALGPTPPVWIQPIRSGCTKQRTQLPEQTH